MVEAKSFRELVGAGPSTASAADSTLIIIDAQNEYAVGHLKTVDIESTRKAIVSLLEKYRSAGKASSIVHVVHVTPDGAPVFTPGTELAKEFDELAPKEGEHLISKHFPSCFAQTDLDSYLKGLGDAGKKIVLTGYMAHVCVSTTARAGAERGYDVLLAEDAIGDRDIPGLDGKAVKNAVLKELGDAFGTVVNSYDID